MKYQFKKSRRFIYRGNRAQIAFYPSVVFKNSLADIQYHGIKRNIGLNEIGITSL